MPDGPLRPSIPLAMLFGLLLEISAIFLRCSGCPVLGKVGRDCLPRAGRGHAQEERREVL